MKTEPTAIRNETPVEARRSNGVVRQQICGKLVKELGGTYASALGIDLASIESNEVFKWFLASLLFGARISENIVMRTYKEFEKTGVLSSERVLATGWQSLVDILDRGGYVRYDFKTAMKLQEATWSINEKYKGDLNRLHFFAKDERDLEKKLRDLGKGISPVTVNLFLRELRDLWEKAEPPLSKPALLASKNLGLTEAADAEVVLNHLRAMWEADKSHDGWWFSHLEAALVRLGKNFCCRNGCSLCPVNKECPHGK